jgi:hypothetical protein
LGVIAVRSFHLGPWLLFVAAVAGIGILLGLFGLLRPLGGKRSTALAGIVLCAAGPFGVLLVPRAGPSAHESSTLGDVRSLLAAEAAYRAWNGGSYDRLECLSRPWECLPGYPEPVFFLEPEMASLQPRSGYDRFFFPGPAARAGKSPSSISSWAYVAVPTRPGQTGTRGFCADSTERICVTADGSMPPIAEARCVVSGTWTGWFTRGRPICRELR